MKISREVKRDNSREFPIDIQANQGTEDGKKLAEIFVIPTADKYPHIPGISTKPLVHELVQSLLLEL